MRRSVANVMEQPGQQPGDVLGEVSRQREAKAEAAKEQQAAAKVALDELAKAIANDKSFTAAEVGAALEEAGEPLENLRARVDYYADRAAKAARFAELPALRNEIAEVEAAAAREREALARLSEAHRERLRPLEARRQELALAIEAIEPIPGELRAAYVGPLCERLVEVEATRVGVNRQIASLRERAEHLEGQIRTTRVNLDTAKSYTKPDDQAKLTAATDEKIRQLQQQADEARDEIGELGGRLAQVDQKEVEIRAAMEAA